MTQMSNIYEKEVGNAYGTLAPIEQQSRNDLSFGGTQNNNRLSMSQMALSEEHKLLSIKKVKQIAEQNS